MKKKKLPLIIAAAIILLATGFAVGLLTGRTSGAAAEDKSTPSAETPKTLWTCSMHPQIKMDKPGKCPICGMNLIPLKSDGAAAATTAAPVLKMTPEAEKLADVRVAPVRRERVVATIRMTGKVEMDERRVEYITARMPGRIDRLFIDYTGIPVRKGDHMAEYYSPDLLVAQRELLMAMKAINAGGVKRTKYSLSPESILTSVRTKLKYWGLTGKNIDTIIKTGKVSQHVTLYAPISGIVIEKYALEGKYFATGDRLFTIADLSRVWIMLEAYESELAKLRYGQKVGFTTESWPGKTFHGMITFISPVMDTKTRVVKVRVDAPNPNGKLKPGMFVRAVVKSAMSANGTPIADASLLKKWICPMHPGIIKDAPGNCDICGMPLVKGSTLPYVQKAVNEQSPLVVPATAPLLTGTRAVVYVKTAPGAYEGREIVLGPRCGDKYIVKSGLKAGELVVVNGNFKIDSALQITAKSSMMSLPDDVVGGHSKPTPPPPPKKFVKALTMIYSNYFKLHDALAGDDFPKSVSAVKMLRKMLEHIPGGLLDDDSRDEWESLKASLDNASAKAAAAKDIEEARAAFEKVSILVEKLWNRFGTDGIKIRKFFCPMAFNNKGAYWLDDSDKVANPYFGAAMPTCGSVVK